MTIKEIIDEIQSDGYIPVFEIALFDNDEYVPDQIYEFYLDEEQYFLSKLGELLMYKDYPIIQVSLIGQNDDADNMTVYNIKDIGVNNYARK